MFRFSLALRLSLFPPVCLLGLVFFALTPASFALAEDPPPSPPASEWFGLWQDRLSPPADISTPALTDRRALGAHFVLFDNGHFYDPFDPTQCAPSESILADYAGTWTRTDEGLRFHIEIERVLKGVTCLCTEDEDALTVCEASFESEDILRSEGKVIDARFTGFSDGDQVYPTPGQGDDLRFPAAEMLGKPYYRHPLIAPKAPQTSPPSAPESYPAAYFTLPGATIHPDILAYFGCKAGPDGKVGC